MVRPADRRRRCRGWSNYSASTAGTPLYGSLELEGGQPYQHRLLEGRGALVRPELLAQLDVAIGDVIVIGETRFTIRGVVSSEPGRRAGAFSFGTRVILDRRDLEARGLLGFGSRATYRLLVKMPGADPEKPLATAAGLPRPIRLGADVSVDEDDLGRELGRAENYLSLVGLIIVMLGGVGVWSVIRVFVQQKLRSIAILKCVGGSTRQILTVYVAQVFLMALTGSALGVVVAAGAVAWVRPPSRRPPGSRPPVG